MITAEQVSAKMFGHLGIVAATVDKLGIVEKIDRLIVLGANSKTTIGRPTWTLREIRIRLRAATKITAGMSLNDAIHPTRRDS